MYFVVTQFARPYPLLMLLLGILVVLQWSKATMPRWLRVGSVVTYLMLLFVSLPPVAFLALGSLEWWYPPAEEMPSDVRVMIVLSGSVIPGDSVRPRSLPGVDTLYRCLHAADLQRRNAFDLIVLSGGKVHPDTPGPTLARLMAEFLEMRGVARERLVLEEQSRSTYENAVESSRLLKERGVTRIVLVTDGASLFRAERCFQRQGIEVVPSGCRYRASEFNWELASFLPSADAVNGVSEACHEWLGVVWYWLHGRIG